MSKPDLISLQGELFLAKITNGVPGTLISAGNMPEVKLAISNEMSDHYNAKDGTRAKDASLSKAVGLAFSGILEELSKQNRNILFSSETATTTAETITNKSIGSVAAGGMINLGHRNLSNVVFKTAPDATVEGSKYTLDAIYGTVVFNEAITGEVSWSGTAGSVERSAIATKFDTEYAALFKGVDTFNGDKVVADIWRLKFSPETEFDLINEDFASYSVSGEALADSSKASDSTMGPFGRIERFKPTTP